MLSLLPKVLLPHLTQGFSHSKSPIVLTIHNDLEESPTPPCLLQPSLYRFYGALLFIDISGFSALSTTMGPDRFRQIVNQYFSFLIEVIYKYEGDIIKFAGDALMIVWKIDSTQITDERMFDCTMLALSCAVEVKEKCQDFRICFEKSDMPELEIDSTDNLDIGQVLKLNVHSAITAGLMASVDVGHGNRWEQFIVGTPVLDISIIDLIGKGQIGLSKVAHSILFRSEHFNDGRFKGCSKCEKLSENCFQYQLLSSEIDVFELSRNSKIRKIHDEEKGFDVLLQNGVIYHIHESVRSQFECHGPSDEGLSKFSDSTMENIIDFDSELRSVVTLFIHIDIRKDIIAGQSTSDESLQNSEEIFRCQEHDSDKDLLQTLQKCMQIFVDAVNCQLGQVRQFMLDDKGLVGIATFGLKKSVSKNNCTSAVKASLLLKNRYYLHDIPIRMGLTLGKAYCGFIGSNIRREYGVMGKSVNLAARLMGSASFGSVICDAKVFQRNTAHSYVAMNAVKAKGYTELIQTYIPLDNSETVQSITKEGRHMGRTSEINCVFSALGVSFAMIKDGSSESINFNNEDSFRLVVIEGMSGIGKSYLLNAISSILHSHQGEGCSACIFESAGNCSDQLTPFLAWKKVFQETISQVGFISSIQHITDETAADCLSSNTSENKSLFERGLAIVTDQVATTLKAYISLIDYFIGNGSVVDNVNTAKLVGVERMKMSIQLFSHLLQLAVNYLATRSHFVVIIMDDIHFLDTASWELLLYMYENCSKVRLLCAYSNVAGPPLPDSCSSSVRSYSSCRTTNDGSNVGMVAEDDDISSISSDDSEYLSLSLKIQSQLSKIKFEGDSRMCLLILGYLSFSSCSCMVDGFLVNIAEMIADFPAIHDLIYQVSKGNPGHIHEITTTFNTTLRYSNATSRAEYIEYLTLKSVLLNMHDLITYQYDRLSTKLQLLLKLASIWGVSGWHFTTSQISHLLSCINQELLRPSLKDGLSLPTDAFFETKDFIQLVDASQFIRYYDNSHSEISESTRFVFTSLQHHKVVYSLLLEGQKRFLHKFVAVYIEELLIIKSQPVTSASSTPVSSSNHFPSSNSDKTSFGSICKISAEDFNILGHHYRCAASWHKAMVCHFNAALILEHLIRYDSICQYCKSYNMMRNLWKAESGYGGILLRFRDGCLEYKEVDVKDVNLPRINKGVHDVENSSVTGKSKLSNVQGYMASSLVALWQHSQLLPLHLHFLETSINPNAIYMAFKGDLILLESAIQMLIRLVQMQGAWKWDIQATRCTIMLLSELLQLIQCSSKTSFEKFFMRTEQDNVKARSDSRGGHGSRDDFLNGPDTTPVVHFPPIHGAEPRESASRENSRSTNPSSSSTPSQSSSRGSRMKMLYGEDIKRDLDPSLQLFERVGGNQQELITSTGVNLSPIVEPTGYSTEVFLSRQLYDSAIKFLSTAPLSHTISGLPFYLYDTSIIYPVISMMINQCLQGNFPDDNNSVLMDLGAVFRSMSKEHGNPVHYVRSLGALIFIHSRYCDRHDLVISYTQELQEVYTFSYQNDLIKIYGQDWGCIGIALGQSSQILMNDFVAASKTFFLVKSIVSQTSNMGTVGITLCLLCSNFYLLNNLDDVLPLFYAHFKDVLANQGFFMFRSVTPLIMEFLLCHSSLTETEQDCMASTISNGKWREHMATDLLADSIASASFSPALMILAQFGFPIEFVKASICLAYALKLSSTEKTASCRTPKAYGADDCIDVSDVSSVTATSSNLEGSAIEYCIAGLKFLDAGNQTKSKCVCMITKFHKAVVRMQLYDLLHKLSEDSKTQAMCREQMHNELLTCETLSSSTNCTLLTLITGRLLLSVDGRKYSERGRPMIEQSLKLLTEMRSTAEMADTEITDTEITDTERARFASVLMKAESLYILSLPVLRG